MSFRSVFSLALLLACACQVYDFEPVHPVTVGQTTQSTPVVAHTLKPNMMLLVDKSGSMAGPIDPTDPNCQVGGATCGAGTCPGGGNCPSTCKTRISELRAAKSDFLGDAGTVARFGLTAFPTGCLCESPQAPQDVLVPISASNDVDSELQLSADQVVAAIQNLSPGGGTPTSAALAVLGASPALADPTRDNFILLLTDGEPNCNASNPTNACGAGSCQCTTSSCAGSFCSIGCLDQDGSVATIAALAAQKPPIRTIVVGFGGDAAGTFGTGYAPPALNAMALAGGMPRACPLGTDAECSLGVAPDTCDTSTGLCHRSFYLATDAAQLEASLAQIVIEVPHPCSYVLEVAPSDPSLLAVLVNGQDVPSSGNWTYSPPVEGSRPTVTFTGSVCAELESSTPAHPVQVEFRILQIL